MRLKELKEKREKLERDLEELGTQINELEEMMITIMQDTKQVTILEQKKKPRKW